MPKCCRILYLYLSCIIQLKEIRVIVKANGDTASKEDMKSLISDLDTCLIASVSIINMVS